MRVVRMPEPSEASGVCVPPVLFVAAWLAVAAGAVVAGVLPDARGGGEGTVRVAAIQCPSAMGGTEANSSNLVALIRQAARDGARIIVTPECAVQGYAYPPAWMTWSRDTNAMWYVARSAEPIPGPATQRFSALSDELDVYLCIGMVERAGDRYFNAQVLLAPDGTLAAHHRKQTLWTPGDGSWCSRGDRPVQVVETPYGRIGLMICFDFHTLPPLLARQRAEIVLYSVGWYGPNEKDWFENQFPRRAVIPHGFSVVSANWSASGPGAEGWPGTGHSCIIGPDGKARAMANTTVGNEIVIADLPLRRAPPVGLVAKLAAGRKQTIVAYGTSLTHSGAWVGQLQAALEARYPGQATVINSGASGQWSQWGVANLDARVVENKPDAVFIEFGVNDAVARFNCSVEMARANLETMIRRIRAANPVTEVYLLTMTPADAYPQGHVSHRNDVAAYYQMYRDVAKQRGLRLVDIYPAWKTLQAADRADFARLVPDSVHATEEGCRRVVTPVVLKSLGLGPDAAAPAGAHSPRR